MDWAVNLKSAPVSPDGFIVSTLALYFNLFNQWLGRSRKLLSRWLFGCCQENDIARSCPTQKSAPRGSWSIEVLATYHWPLCGRGRGSTALLAYDVHKFRCSIRAQHSDGLLQAHPLCDVWRTTCIAASFDKADRAIPSQINFSIFYQWRWSHSKSR